MNKLACALAGVKNERIALCDVAVAAILQDLLCEVTVAQTYRNDERVNIEAVYTFPLPLDAVLLDLEVAIGGRVLKGVVVEKKAAEEKYEDAVAAGDAAVMLEMIEPGLYTMNVGNLLPGEKATITFRYAILYRWAGDRLRFFLPTTIAPRYGASPHAPHQAPESSLMVENRFSLTVEVCGSLRDAQFTCSSHPVTLARSADKTVISLQQEKAVMDRDFILHVKASRAARGFALCGADGDGVAAVASFQPFFPGLQQPRPLNLAIVIDCSGSMQGDSMTQAKHALDGILDALESHDRVTLVAFGSSTRALSQRLLPCTKANLAKARRFAQQLDANMGGTEIGPALRAAYAAIGESGAADIFLVTDGEVSSWQDVVAEAQRTGHRVFTVGVGSAVSEAFMRGLAAGTGGECELVSPREGMSERVVRHFERMRAPRAKRVAVRWPEGAGDFAPSKPGAVFEGDTLIACARFERPVVGGAVVLEVETEQGEIVRHELALSMPASDAASERMSTVARLAAAARLKELNGGAALQTALRYRLASPWTNWLVIAERPEGEKTQDFPALRKVPQTLAAGWGGVGAIAQSMSMDMLSTSRTLYSRAASIPGDLGALLLSGDDDAREILPPGHSGPSGLLLALIEAEPSRLAPDRALDLLREAGLAGEFDEIFRHAAKLGLNAEAVAALILAELLRGPLGDTLSADAKRVLVALQDHAQRMAEALREIGQHGAALMQAVASPLARNAFDPGMAHGLAEVFGRLARYRDFLDHIKAAARDSAMRLAADRPSPAQRTSRTIF